jgi:hypothetical protein
MAIQFRVQKAFSAACKSRLEDQQIGAAEPRGISPGEQLTCLISMIAWAIIGPSKATKGRTKRGI